VLTFGSAFERRSHLGTTRVLTQEDVFGYLMDDPGFHRVLSESVALCCHFIFVEVLLSRVLLGFSSVRVGSYGVLGELGGWRAEECLALVVVW
jgi:hypothetical protein